jgi:hypothetical protein
MLGDLFPEPAVAPAGGWSRGPATGCAARPGAPSGGYISIFRTLFPVAAKILEDPRAHSTLFFHQEKSFHDHGPHGQRERLA